MVGKRGEKGGEKEMCGGASCVSVYIANDGMCVYIYVCCVYCTNVAMAYVCECVCECLLGPYVHGWWMRCVYGHPPTYIHLCIWKMDWYGILHEKHLKCGDDWCMMWMWCKKCFRVAWWYTMVEWLFTHCFGMLLMCFSYYDMHCLVWISQCYVYNVWSCHRHLVMRRGGVIIIHALCSWCHHCRSVLPSLMSDLGLDVIEEYGVWMDLPLWCVVFGFGPGFWHFDGRWPVQVHSTCPWCCGLFPIRPWDAKLSFCQHENPNICS